MHTAPAVHADGLRRKVLMADCMVHTSNVATPAVNNHDPLGIRPFFWRSRTSWGLWISASGRFLGMGACSEHQHVSGGLTAERHMPRAAWLVSGLQPHGVGCFT